MIGLDMKKIRDQARKENNALKGKAKGKAKAMKASAATVVDNLAAADAAVFKKTADVKDKVVHAMQTAKENTRADAKQMGKIKKDIGSGAGKILRDIKHTGHDVAEKLKHH